MIVIQFFLLIRNYSLQNRKRAILQMENHGKKGKLEEKSFTQRKG